MVSGAQMSQLLVRIHGDTRGPSSHQGDGSRLSSQPVGGTHLPPAALLGCDVQLPGPLQRGFQLGLQVDGTLQVPTMCPRTSEQLQGHGITF